MKYVQCVFCGRLIPYGGNVFVSMDDYNEPLCSKQCFYNYYNITELSRKDEEYKELDWKDTDQTNIDFLNFLNN